MAHQPVHQPQKRACGKQHVHVERYARSVFCLYGFYSLWQKGNCSTKGSHVANNISVGKVFHEMFIICVDFKKQLPQINSFCTQLQFYSSPCSLTILFFPSTLFL